MKKGFADTNKQLFWTFFVLSFIVLIIGVLLFIVPRLLDVRTGVHPNLQDYMLKERLLSSHTCLAYKDDSGNVYANYIDLVNFNDDRLNCLQEKRGQAVMLILHYQKDNLSILEIKSEQFAVVHGSATKLIYFEPVIVVDEEDFFGAFLELHIYR